MRIHHLVAALAWFGGGLLIPQPLENAKAADRIIKRSDVILMGNYNPEIMGDKGPELAKVSGGTVINWGGRPWDTKTAVQERVRRVKAFHDLGVRFSEGPSFARRFGT